MKASSVDLEEVREEARRAAEAIAAERSDVARVMLFGSTARGEADHDSDIDLVVVLNDLGDYWQRRRVKAELADAAKRVASRRLDLHVTDRPEWKLRTERVSASFEASLSGDLVTLIENFPLDEPDWGKPMIKPTSNLAEAATRCGDMAQRLRDLIRYLHPDSYEQAAEDEQERDIALKNRRRMVCGHAADASEVAVKTVIALGGTSPARTHDIEDLLAQVRSRPMRQELATIVEEMAAIVESCGVGPEAISAWHVKATYANDVEAQWVDAQAQMPKMVQLAHDLAVRADRAFEAAGGDPAVSRRVKSALADLRRAAPWFTRAPLR